MLKQPPATSEVLEIVIVHDGEDLVLNPNQLTALALVPDIWFRLLQPLTQDWRSDISGETGCVCYRDADGSVVLTIDELTRLAGLRLREQEYLALVTKYGIRHMWHDDFYLSNGLALQPRQIL